MFYYNFVLMILIFIMTIALIMMIVVANNISKRKEQENIALQEIKIGMTKNEADSVLGNGVLEKQTQKYEQYRYLETNKMGNISYSLNSNLKGGRTYIHNKKSYLAIKYSNDEEKRVIEIINKL